MKLPQDSALPDKSYPMLKRQMQALYGAFFEMVSAVLYQHDPVGINFEDNPDEYDPEATYLLERELTSNLVEIGSGEKGAYPAR